MECPSQCLTLAKTHALSIQKTPMQTYLDPQIKRVYESKLEQGIHITSARCTCTNIRGSLKCCVCHDPKHLGRKRMRKSQKPLQPTVTLPIRCARWRSWKNRAQAHAQRMACTWTPPCMGSCSRCAGSPTRRPPSMKASPVMLHMACPRLLHVASLKVFGKVIRCLPIRHWVMYVPFST